MALRQRDVDEGLQMCLILTDGRTQIMPRPEWSEVILNYSVSEYVHTRSHWVAMLLRLTSAGMRAATTNFGTNCSR